MAFNCSGTISTTFTLPGAGAATFELAGNAVTITSLQSDPGGGSYDSNNIDGTLNVQDSVGGGILYVACGWTGYGILATPTGGVGVNGTLNINSGEIDVLQCMTIAGTVNVAYGAVLQAESGGAEYDCGGCIYLAGGNLNLNNGTLNVFGYFESDSGVLSSTSISHTYISGPGEMLLIMNDDPALIAGTTVVGNGGELYVYNSYWTGDTYDNEGTLYVGSGGVVQDTGVMWTDVVNSGTINLNGSGLTVNDFFQNLEGGVLNIQSGTLTNYGTFYNYGSVNAINGNFNNYGTVYNYAGYGAFYASSANFNYNEFGTYIGTAIDWY